MRRPQFSLKTMLWLMAMVAAFFGGIALQRQLDTQPVVLRVRQDAKFEDVVDKMTALSEAGVNVKVAPADRAQRQPIITVPYRFFSTTDQLGAQE